MNPNGFRAAFLALLLIPPALAEIKVEATELAPAGQWIGCTLSPVGVHAAVLVSKGSGFAILVDGVEGPAFDQLLPHDGRTLTLPKAPSATTRIPVVFSDDGLHHAYFAKKGDEYVLIRNGREVARGKATAKIQNLVFSAGGKRLSFVESNAPNSHQIVIDGKPESAVVDVPKIIFSPDGARYAYLARKPGEARASLFVDGEPAGHVAEEPQFTSDNRLVCVSRVARDDHRLMLDGQPLWRAKRIVKVYLSPASKQIFAVVGNDPQIGQHLVIDGNKVPGSDCNAIRNVIFSRDGQRYAAICRTQEYTKALNVTNVREFVLLDGKKGQTYHSIRDAADSSQDLQRLMWLSGGHTGPGIPPRNTPGFTADSSRFVYLAAVPPNEFVVIDETASEPFPLGKLRDPLVNRDGRHVALVALEDGSKATIVVGGRKQDFPGFFHSFSLSPDGTRHAYVRSLLTVDGVEQQLTVTSPASYLFSPDSKHLAVVGQVPGTPTRGLFIDGKLAVPNASPVTRPVFTPDSRHLFWLGGRGEGPATDAESATLVVDGRIALRFRELINTRENWVMSPDGVLTFVARSGDGLKRYRVTPSRETSVTAMIPGDATAVVAASTTNVAPAAAVATPAVATPAYERGSGAAPAYPREPAALPTQARSPGIGGTGIPSNVPGAIPGRTGETARQVDQTANELQRTKAEIDRAKNSIKSLWDTVVPKKKAEPAAAASATPPPPP
jgi:hypothetical protein